MLQLQFLGLLLSAFVCTLSGQGDNRTELHVAFITSFSGEYDSFIAVPAVRLAASKINENETLLADYKLVVELVEDRSTAESFANSKCNWIDSQRTFLEQITSGQPKVALIGCGCSLATEPVAVSSNFWNITHISYTPTSELLSQRRDNFSNFWSTFPPAATIASPLMAILGRYKWTKIKIITQAEDLFRLSMDNLISELRAINVTVDMTGTTVFFTDSNVYNLSESELFPEENRVYFLNMYPTHARRIMCRAAYNQRTNPNPEHHYPGYIWITLGWYRDDWWRERVANDNQLRCSDSDLAPLIRNTFSIQLGNGTLDNSADTDVGVSPAELERQIAGMANYQLNDVSSVAYHAYDAVWMLAFGINRSLSDNSSEDLENFNYRGNARSVTNLITAQFNGTFNGVSGEVTFDMYGNRVPVTAKIFKYGSGTTAMNTCGQTNSGAQRYLIATDNNSTLVYTDCENDGTVWADGVPSDGTPIVIITTFFTPLYIIYNVAVLIGIAFAVVCLLFNCIFRRRHIVRLISPNLNYVIILGAILMYITVTFFVFPVTDPLWATFACQFRIWTQTLGYFLCFGTILAKMWRIYYIFHRRKIEVTSERQMAIKDWHLLLIVLAMCSVVVIIGIFVAIFGDYRAVQVPDRERPITRNEDNVLFDKHNLVCQGPRDLIWIIILYLYILLTQLVAVFLAIKTRKVEIKILNDAKYVVTIIYVSSIILIIMIICAVVLSNFLNADGAVFGGLIYIFITTILSVLFIPKMVILYKDPEGKNIMRDANIDVSHDDTAVTFTANKEAIAFDQKNDTTTETAEDQTKVTNGTSDQFSDSQPVIADE